MNVTLLFGCFILAVIITRTINPVVIIPATGILYWLISWVVKTTESGG